MRNKIMSLCMLALTFYVGKADATVIHVDASHTAAPQNGSSWGSAFSSFQAGVNAASAGDTVWVAQGNYNPPNILSPFAMKEGVKIFGGFLNTYTSFSQRNFTTNISHLQNNAQKVMYNSTALTQAAVLDGFTISGGGNTGSGGAIANDNCSPLIRNCHITGNVAGSGGGISNNASAGQTCAPHIDSCIFDNNTASISGGAISNTNCTPTISNCSFINNTRVMNTNYVAAGGAIYNYQSTVVINNCNFTDNSANGGSTQPMGGAIYSMNSTVTLTNSSFTSNVATAPSGMNILDGYGGAFYSTGSNVVMGACSFLGNQANSAGGAVYIDGGSMTVADCNFTGNSLTTPYDFIPKMGAGVYIHNVGALNSLGDCTFTGNTVELESGMGGGIYIANANPLLYHNTFTGNKAQYGGGIFNASSMPEIRSNIFSNDTATNSGGAIFDSLSAPLLVNCLLYANVADSFGGAYYSHGSSGKLINSTISQNTAFLGGAQYNVSSSSPRLLNSVAWGNTSGIGNDAGSGPVLYYSLLQGYPADAAHHNIDGNTDPLFTNAATGDFTLQATSPCINTGNNDSIPDNIITDLAGHARIFANTVDMGPYEVPLPPEVMLGADTTICAGSSLVLDAGNPGASYTWNNGDTTRALTVNTAGTYWVAVADTMGSASDTITVGISALPVVQLGNDTTLAAGQTLVLDAGNPGSTYLWSTGATTQTITVTTTGTYSVTVTNANGCGKTDAINVGTVGVNNVTVADIAIFVSPNPASGMATIHISDPKLLHTKAILMDSYGRVVDNILMDNEIQMFSLEGYASGIYMLKLENGQAIKVAKQ